MEVFEKVIAEIATRVGTEYPDRGMVVHYCIALERTVKLVEQVTAALAPNPKEGEATRPQFFDVTSLTAEEAQEKVTADAKECRVVEELLQQFRQQTLSTLEPLMVFWCEECGVSKQTATAFIATLKQEFG